MQKKIIAPKVEFNDELLKTTKTDIQLRPNSSKQIPSIRSPLPPRKPILSQHQQQRKIPSEISTVLEIKVTRPRSITPNQLKLNQAVQISPIKITNKQPATSEKKIPNVILRKPEKIQQFKISTKQSSSVERKNQSNNSSPSSKQQNIWIREEIGKMIINQETKKKNYFREQNYKKPKQEFNKPIPKCAQDFSMTAHKNDLPKLLEQFQIQFKNTIAPNLLQYQQVLNMSEIQELNEEGLSSHAQSTLYYQQ